MIGQSDYFGFGRNWKTHDKRLQPVLTQCSHVNVSWYFDGPCELFSPYSQKLLEIGISASKTTTSSNQELILENQSAHTTETTVDSTHKI